MGTKKDSNLHRFSDFAHDFIGPKVHTCDIMNQDITILGFKKQPSKVDDYETSEYGMFQIEIEGRKYVLFTSSKVLISQAETYMSQIPFIARVTKHKGFYTFA